MSKRPPPVRQYDQSLEDRQASTLQFLMSLRFSRPLSDLRSSTERLPCPKCGKRRQYYCYDCLVVCSPGSHPQPLRLPVSVYVILHPGENRGKSTTLPIATISPDVTISTYPTVPDLDHASTLVLYPSEKAQDIAEVHDIDKIKAFVFVDSTWQQSKCIAGDERVRRFRHVKLSGIVSLFWRFQDKDPYHLATVEAIYHSLRQLIIARNRLRAQDNNGTAPAEYSGEVDDLLYYYVNQYIAVQQHYASPNREFTDKHFQGYILKGLDWNRLLEQQGRAAATQPSAEPCSGAAPP